MYTSTNFALFTICLSTEVKFHELSAMSHFVIAKYETYPVIRHSILKGKLWKLIVFYTFDTLWAIGHAPALLLSSKFRGHNIPPSPNFSWFFLAIICQFVTLAGIVKVFDIWKLDCDVFYIQGIKYLASKWAMRKPAEKTVHR